MTHPTHCCWSFTNTHTLFCGTLNVNFWFGRKISFEKQVEKSSQHFPSTPFRKLPLPVSWLYVKLVTSKDPDVGKTTLLNEPKKIEEKMTHGKISLRESPVTVKLPCFLSLFDESLVLRKYRLDVSSISLN